MITIQEMEDFFVVNKYDVHIQHYDFTATWKISVTKTDQGTTINTTADAASIREAMHTVYQRIYTISRIGIPNMTNAIAHRPEQPKTLKELNDEMPF